MVNSKRRLEEDGSDDEHKEEIVASSSQLNAGSQFKRARLAANGNGRSSLAPEPTRLRPEESDDEDDVDELATPAPPASYAGRPATSNGRAKPNVAMQVDDDSESEEDDDNNVEDEDEEDDGGDDARDKALNAQISENGAVAKAGVIDTVVLKNFMCHPHMEVKLNPQINFIIGHNGSGKSVILTAITYAFGAKASASNRGTSQNSFIREGAPACEVTVSLRNKGEEAYKADVYGKKIYITRRTTTTGSSSYKIANADRKTVETTKGELSAICDHFQIQVDNPVNILHQDMAKLFLHSSKPQDKYRFFLKGTQLEQLLEEYQVLFHQTQALQQITRTKKDRLEELKEKMKEAHAAWKEIEQARNVESNIRKLKNELAWTHVVEIERQTGDAVAKQSEEEEKVAKITMKLRAAERELEEAQARLTEAQTAQDDDSALERLNQEMKEVAAKIKEITSQMAEARGEQREMQENIQRLRNVIAARDRDLLEAQSKADGPLRQKMIESRARLDEVNQSREDLGSKVTLRREKAVEMTRLIDEERGKWEHVKREQEIAKQAFEQAETQIRSIQASQENTLNRFGNYAANIVQAIERERGWRHKPIGPIGNFIKLKDRRWAKVCEAVCGDRLNSFLVSTDEDRFRLNNLIKNFRGARHNVLRYEWDDRFENGLQANLPDRQFVTLLDVLTFDDAYVRQAFIATVQPEASILVTERRVGDDIMRNNDPERTKIRNCYTSDLYSLGGIRGGSRMIALQQYRGPPRLSKDVEADRQRALEARAEAEGRLRQANEERGQVDRLLANYTLQKKQAETDAENMSKQIRRLELEREKLKAESEDYQTTDVQAIEAEKQAALEEIETVRAQGNSSATHISELQQSCRPYVTRKEEIASLISQTELIKRSQQEAMDTLITTKVSKEHEVDAWKKKKAQHMEKARELEATVTSWGERLQAAMDQAGEMCPRESIELHNRSVKKLETTIASLEKALRQREARLGGSSEEVHKRYVRAKADYEDNQKTVKDLRECAGAMMDAYEIRMNRWTTFRSSLSTTVRTHFIRNLSQRGYNGDLRFRHNDHRLELQVQPGEDGDKKSQRAKDSSTLSGGEKSFSTICLLLALWAASGSHVRGLDEYDVFMDAVNRRIATNMLVRAGKSTNSTQMILISPHSIQGQASKPGVRIIRIADPERGQGTLATNMTG